jgi:UDP-N-acetylglucosamine transferase subunit ALG13
VIFGTVGTHDAPFDRLISALDDVAANVSEDVIVQTGTSRLHLRSATGISFIKGGEFGRLMQEARVIVTHGGDTILEAIDTGAAVVVVPRRRQFHEHIDNHQAELAEALAARGLVTWTEPDDLDDAIRRATPTRARSNPVELADSIRSAMGV